MEKISIRSIIPKDNIQLAVIIRNALTEFKANKPGTVYFDNTTDHLFELFNTGNCVYKVAEIDDIIVGGAGIFNTDGLAADTCELVKLYLAPQARGKGIAKQLIKECLDAANKYGYTKMYLETMPELINAIPMYEKFGFTYLKNPLGNSGHNGCNIWMIKVLS